METNIILQGDALTKLKELPNESIDCVMTSPPYWALRDYGVEGQLGLEPTFEQYINELCDIFDEVKRVLKKSGTCWVNLGDTYSGSSSYSDKGRQGFEGKTANMKEYLDPKLPARKRGREQVDMSNIKDKCLCMIPERFAIEMCNRGWILRNKIIWHKPNCMPSSVKDRFTVDFEELFFFTKNKKYYFEQQLEPTITKDKIIRDRDTTKLNNTPGRTRMGGLDRNDYDFKNKRAVWKITPRPFKEAHFAVYPEELCETPIKAGCPEFVCIKCGCPKFPIYIASKEYEELLKSQRKTEAYTSKRRGESMKVGNAFGVKKVSSSPDYKISFEPTCKCNASFTEGIVLDPFFGAGTTGLVALKQNKKFIGIELNPEYIEIAKNRLKPYLEQTKLGS